MACGILVHRPGITPGSPKVETQSLDHWSTQEVPLSFLNQRSQCWKGLENSSVPPSLILQMAKMLSQKL